MTSWVDSSLRPFARATVLFASLAACGAVGNRADAQSLYYRTIPIGERAIGLGGAFTGVASDPSATYYNPAGIMSGGRFQLLGSFSSLVFARKKIENAFESPAVEADFTAKRTSTIPRFIGTAVKFGRKRFGDHQFALGYSTLEVDRNEFNASSIQSDSASSLDLRLNNDYSSRWYGVSFAAQATKKTALGFTAFVAQQRGFYSEDIGVATGWNPRRERSPNRWRLGHIEHLAFRSELGHRPSAGCTPSIQPPLAVGDLVPNARDPREPKGQRLSPLDDRGQR